MSLTLLALALAANADAAETKRFALVAGANDGGPGRAELRYAGDDARAVASVLETLGGVGPGDRTLLANPDRDGMIAAIHTLRDQVVAAESAGYRTEMVVYYSGHSDETGLLLGATRYEYQELRAALVAIPADVHLVVLDSCSSGAITREKGGVRQAPFLIDQSTDVAGYAYLTSSSEDEAAQESDRIGGSFFTHYLLTGLRGGADLTGDDKVTLNEAYQFAYAATLARTERTMGGPQHPAYDIRLSGSGDLVLTDLRATSAALSLDGTVEGRLFVRDEEDRLVAELFKPATRELELGLGPGRYRVTLEREGRFDEASFTLAEGQTVRLSELQFASVEAEIATLRGGAARVTRHEAFTFPLLPTDLAADDRVVHHLDLGFGVGGAAQLEGLALTLAGNIVSEDVYGAQGSVGFNIAGGDVNGAQASVGANVAGGDVRGVQAAVGASLAGGDVTGVQAAAGGSIAGGHVRGVQAGTAIAAAESVAGLQSSAGISLAERVDGAQISIVNAGAKVKGAQIGIVNVAGEVDGVQVGVVNIATDNRGTPIGLVNINLTGYNHLQLAGSDSEALLGGTFGGKRLYTLAQVGWRPGEEAPGDFSTLLGLGWHQPAGERFFLDADVAAGSARMAVDSEIVLVRARMIGGLRFAPGLAVFAGPTFNLIPYADGGAEPASILPIGSIQGLPAWWGFTAGIRI